MAFQLPTAFQYLEVPVQSSIVTAASGRFFLKQRPLDFMSGGRRNGSFDEQQPVLKSHNSSDSGTVIGSARCRDFLIIFNVNFTANFAITDTRRRRAGKHLFEGTQRVFAWNICSLKCKSGLVPRRQCPQRFSTRATTAFAAW